jgi:DNA polymerase-1
VLEYFGAGPDKVIDIQALAGDSTDNVPGAPGIGVKTAAQLIAEFGSLDQLLDRAGEIKQPKRRETLTNPETVKLIRISKQLVTLAEDVAVEEQLDDLALATPDAKTLVAFFKAMEFTSLTRRAAEIYSVDAGAIEPDPAFVGPAGWRNRNGETKDDAVDWPSPTPKAEISAPAKEAARSPTPAATQEPILTPQGFAAQRLAEAREGKLDRSGYATVRTLDALRGWIAEAYEAGIVALDVETDSLDPMQAELVGFSLCVAPGKACYVPLGHRMASDGALFGGGELLPDQIKESEALALLKPLLEARDVIKIGHNVKFDWVIFAERGIEMKSFDDTMLVSYALDAAATTDGHGMDWLAERFLGHQTIKFAEVAGSGRNFIGFARAPIDKACEYAAEDVDVTLRLWRALKSRLPAEHVDKVYETLERPLVEPLARMERRGV